MKQSKGAIAALGVTAAALVFSAGYFLGSESVSGDYQISVQRQALLPEASATAAVPSSEMSTPQPVDEVPAIVDINSADSETLQTLPGIGPSRAAGIISYREEHGPFRIPEEITNVPGIGEGILAQIIDYIVAEEVEK